MCHRMLKKADVIKLQVNDKFKNNNELRQKVEVICLD